MRRDTAATNDRRTANMSPLTALLCATAIAAAAATGHSQTAITVIELPPETIPAGTCTESTSGFLGVVEKDKTERTKLTTQEIGEYVSKRLAEGYSVTLYPQASGRTFTVATCHPKKP
mgnify:CR=1 FL=1